MTAIAAHQLHDRSTDPKVGTEPVAIGATMIDYTSQARVVIGSAYYRRPDMGRGCRQSNAGWRGSWESLHVKRQGRSW